ncbi:unnamed protein product [Clonostachys chloroleuca]|uniref:Uncharacterized protein n=1 Tax=Clonostachys chloroleuca TaxID=1926264 RepID=A0AA35Q2T4_9HYPO|nr:unnamed protein product [Clonostachys chloroleuca]
MTEQNTVQKHTATATLHRASDSLSAIGAVWRNLALSPSQDKGPFHRFLIRLSPWTTGNSERSFMGNDETRSDNGVTHKEILIGTREIIICPGCTVL